jgi:hypothetical protein
MLSHPAKMFRLSLDADQAQLEIELLYASGAGGGY